MADAYALNLTTRALTKNGVAIANILAYVVTLNFDAVPPNPNIAVGGPTQNFDLEVTTHDVAADARIVAQAPAVLTGLPQFNGYQSRETFRSRRGDTLALTGVPGMIVDGSTVEAPDGDPFDTIDAYHKIGV